MRDPKTVVVFDISPPSRGIGAVRKDGRGFLREMTALARPRFHNDNLVDNAPVGCKSHFLGIGMGVCDTGKCGAKIDADNQLRSPWLKVRRRFSPARRMWHWSIAAFSWHLITR